MISRWLVLFALAVCQGAGKGRHLASSFPPEIDRDMISSTADPADFPPHPGTISHYRGARLISTEPASDAPYDVRFHYKYDEYGKIVARIPVVKSVGWFFKKDHTEAAEGEPYEGGIIVLYDPEGNSVDTIHSGNVYH